MSEPNFLFNSYKAIFNHILDPILIYQVDDQYRFHKMLMINDSFRKSYGYELKEILHADFSMINAHPRKVPDLIENICKHGNVLFETTHKNKAGEEFPVEVHSQFVSMEGHPMIVSIIRDIADRKRVQSELFDLQETRSKTLRLMSHDLRNSFAQMAGALLLLREYSFEASVQELIDLLSEVHDNASRLLMEHLGASDDLGDAMKLEIFPFDLANFLTRLKKKYEVLSQTEKEIDLRCQFPEVSTLIEGDQYKLVRVLDNMMSNAIKFSDSGAKLTFSATINKEHVCFSVKDRGIGIPEELHASIFLADPASGRPGTSGEPSNGLGLFIAKKIVDLHRGNIWFETKEGQGTTFFVEIPKQFMP
ncbi:MAG: PAS domain-containing sensor histidine kinase [Cytophagales bacterium]|nr:PAS domain-containing sensor histidine kinase [Cytophagales bacterium]